MTKIILWLTTMGVLVAATPKFETICNTTIAKGSSSQLLQLCSQYGYSMKPDHSVILKKHKQDIASIANKIEILTGEKVYVKYDNSPQSSSKAFYLKFKLNKDSLIYEIIKAKILEDRYIREALKPFIGVHLSHDYDLLGDYTIELEGDLSKQSLGVSAFRFYVSYNNDKTLLTIDDVGLINNILNINNLSLSGTQKGEYGELKLALLKANMQQVVNAQGFALDTHLNFDKQYTKDVLLSEVTDLKLKSFIDSLNGVLKIDMSVKDIFIDASYRNKGYLKGLNIFLNHNTSNLTFHLSSKKLSFLRAPLEYEDDALLLITVGDSLVSLILDKGNLSISFHNLNLLNNKTIKALNIDTIWSEELKELDKELSPILNAINGKFYNTDVVGLKLDKALDKLFEIIEKDVDRAN